MTCILVTTMHATYDLLAMMPEGNLLCFREEAEEGDVCQRYLIVGATKNGKRS